MGTEERNENTGDMRQGALDAYVLPRPTDGTLDHTEAGSAMVVGGWPSSGGRRCLEMSPSGSRS